MPKNNSHQPIGVQDIFEDVDQHQAGNLSSDTQDSQLTPLPGNINFPAPGPLNETPRPPKTGLSFGLKMIITVVVILAVAILSAGIYMFFIKGNQNNANQEANVNQTTNQAVNKNINVNLNSNTNNANQSAANVNTNLNQNTNKNVNLNTNQILDEDKDGLSDAEEVSLGTDPQNIDSDGDGLYDYEEVKIYSTDPLDSDTDDDSYLDGDEVKNGYNPKGSGKIINLNTNQ